MGDKITAVDYSPLCHLGISQQAIGCYADLCEYGSSVVASIANRQQKHRTGLYRLLHQLETSGFVGSFKSYIGATYYVAVPLDQAIATFHANQRLQVNDLIRQQQQSIRTKSKPPAEH